MSKPPSLDKVNVSNSDQCIYPREHTRFSVVEELTLSKERTLLKLLKRLNSNFKVPSFTEKELEDAIPLLLSSFEYYLGTAWEKVPELFFRVPQVQPLVCVSSPVALSTGEVCDISFKSTFEPVFPDYKDRLSGEPRWNSVRAKYWRHTKEESRGTVIAIHGWMMGDEKASALTMVPGYFYRLGLDVVLFELPFHGLRRPDPLLPTKMFPSLDPACTNESFAQAIFELRAIKDWLLKEKEQAIVGVGLSLGAHTLALWASLDKLDAIICTAPLVSLPNFIWSQVEGGPLDLRLKEAGITREVLERGFAVSNPLSYSLAMDKESALIIAGERDSIVPAEQAKLLWEHWNRPDIHWVLDGHIEQLLAPGTAEKVHTFLHNLGLADKTLRKVHKL